MSIHLNKKRQYDSPDMNDEQNNYSKKLQASPPSTIVGAATLQPVDPNTCHLKILIPSAAAGAIIGKGGETIAEVQQKIGAKIKLSKANDFYPGTNERVCLISGSKDAVTGICQFLQEKVKEKPDPHSKPAIDFDNKVSGRDITDEWWGMTVIHSFIQILQIFRVQEG